MAGSQGRGGWAASLPAGRCGPALGWAALGPPGAAGRKAGRAGSPGGLSRAGKGRRRGSASAAPRSLLGATAGRASTARPGPKERPRSACGYLGPGIYSAFFCLSSFVFLFFYFAKHVDTPRCPGSESGGTGARRGSAGAGPCRSGGGLGGAALGARCLPPLPGSQPRPSPVPCGEPGGPPRGSFEGSFQLQPAEIRNGRANID